MSQLVVNLRGIVLISTTSPEGKGESLDRREQDLVHTHVFESHKMIWLFSCDHFAMQNSALKLNPEITLDVYFGVCLALEEIVLFLSIVKLPIFASCWNFVTWTISAPIGWGSHLEGGLRLHFTHWHYQRWWAGFARIPLALLAMIHLREWSRACF